MLTNNFGYTVETIIVIKPSFIFMDWVSVKSIHILNILSLGCQHLWVVEHELTWLWAHLVTILNLSFSGGGH